MLTNSDVKWQFAMLKKLGVNAIGISILLLFGAFSSTAQTVPLGQWESHFNYLSAQHVVEVGNKIYCSSYNGLFFIDIETKEIKVLSKAEGLSETGVSGMAYNSVDNMLLLTYRNGNIDLVSLDERFEPEQIVPWSVLMDAADLPESKQINQVLFWQDLAYLATNFGIVVLNTKLREVQETYRYIGKNGTEVHVKNVAFASDSIFILTGTSEILGSSMQTSVNRQFFANWKTIPTPGTAMSISNQPGYIYAGFAGKGIFRKSGGSWFFLYPTSSKNYAFSNHAESVIATLDNNVTIINENNTFQIFESSLFRFPKESIRTKNAKVWIADSKSGLVSNAGGDFESFSPIEKDTTINPRTDSTIVDLNGNTWTRLPEYLGGGILFKNTKSSKQQLLTTSPGNGGLPSSGINSIAVDEYGNIWFASDNGAGYFLPEDLSNGSRIDAILPVYGQRRLFANEKCTAIAVEPGNRKWIGTRNGLYHFNEEGTELVQQFSSEDSPLPSNFIDALQFNQEQAMLFVDTPNGMVAYRSTASISSESLSKLTIFPNPVHPGFGGQVGIKGLVDKATVKITTLSGKLVYETKAQGGTASWNLNDYTGRRARGGIYMILVVSADGEKKIAGKLAIID